MSETLEKSVCSGHRGTHPAKRVTVDGIIIKHYYLDL